MLIYKYQYKYTIKYQVIEIKLFDDDKLYKIREIATIVGYSDKHIRTTLKKSNTKTYRIGDSCKNSLRFKGSDLNKAFNVCITDDY